MGDHIGDDAAYVLICRRIKNLFAVPVRAQHPRGAQQPKMMADERRRELRPARDIRNAGWRVQASEDDLEAARISHEPKDFGQLHCVII